MCHEITHSSSYKWKDEIISTLAQSNTLQQTLDSGVTDINESVCWLHDSSLVVVLKLHLVSMVFNGGAIPVAFSQVAKWSLKQPSQETLGEWIEFQCATYVHRGCCLITLTQYMERQHLSLASCPRQSERHTTKWENGLKIQAFLK